MKKLDLGQKVGILANLGVIAGIMFLGLELRQTQRAMQSQAYQARAFDAIAWDFELAKDEDLRRIAWQLTFEGMSVGSLSDSDRQIARYLIDTVRHDADNEHYQYQNGFLDEEHYENATLPMIRFYAPIWRSLGAGEARSDFRREVDRVLSEAP